MTVLLKGLSLLPLPVLYGFASLLFWGSYHLFGYRKSVVRENIDNAFPELPLKQRRSIEKQFYKNLAQWVVEIIKTPSMKKEDLLSRCRIVDNEAFKNLKNNPQSALILTAHFGNWEWAGQTIGLQLSQPVNVVFKRLKSPAINQAMEQIRTRYGNEISPMTQVMRKMYNGKDRNLVSCFLADQSPKTSEAGYWPTFLNRPAPFFNGPEKIARKLNLPVYFGKIRQIQKGEYEIDLQLIAQNAASTKPNEITEAYVNHLESAIREQPENWLWSHRRWKRGHQKPNNA